MLPGWTAIDEDRLQAFHYAPFWRRVPPIRESIFVAWDPETTSWRVRPAPPGGAACRAPAGDECAYRESGWIDGRSVPSPPAQRRARPDCEAYGVVIESVKIMNVGNQATSFRGLPLTEEQEREIRHYIHTRERRGEPWDTPELQAMLADMLDPPEVSDEDAQARDDSMAAERMTAQGEAALDE